MSVAVARIGLAMCVVAMLGLLRPSVAAAQISSSGGIQLLEEGANIGHANSLNCVGGGISCSLSGGVGTMTVTGGGGGGSPPGGATGALQINAGAGAFGGYAGTGASSCSAGNFMTALSSSGAATCVAGGGGGGVSSLNALTGALSITAGTGVSVTPSTPNIAIANTGVTSATGTANQVTVSASTGAVTFSLPQSIGTANAPQFGRLGLNVAPQATQGTLAQTINANAVSGHIIKRFTDTSPTGSFLDFQNAAGTTIYRMDVTGKIATYGAATPANGHLFIGNATTGFYEDSTLTGTANQIAVTNGAGAITLSLPTTVSLTNLTVTGAAPGAGSACLQINSSGVVSNTGATCGSGSAGVTSLNTLTGALSLVAGSNITITPSGSNITIAASGGGGTNATLQVTPSDPTGTTSASQLMMGLGATATITPSNSGKIFVSANFDIKGTAVGTMIAQLRYGTGTAPANGAAATGTTVGRVLSAINTAAGQQYPATVDAVITGLTVSTTYWIDLGVASTSAGTVTVKNVDISGHEF